MLTYSANLFMSDLNFGFLSALIPSREMRILILGLDGAGKTTILYRLQAGEVLTLFMCDDDFADTKTNL